MKKKSLRIVTIVTSFPRYKGDVLIPWIIKLIHLLKEKNITSNIFTSSYKGRQNEIYENIEVNRFRYFYSPFEKLSHDMNVVERIKTNKLWIFVLPFFIFFGFIYSIFYAVKNSFNMIHVHWPFPLAIFGLAMKLVKPKAQVVYTFHGASIILAKRNTLFLYILKFFLKFPKFVTVNSSFTASLVNEIAPSVNVAVIPFGSAVNLKEHNSEKKKKRNKKSSGINILFVGRIVERKGVEYLIEAFEKVARKYPNKLQLTVVGDGPLKMEVENKAERLGIKEHVEFKGFVSSEDLPGFYENADIFVLPAIIDSRGDTEGLGVVLIEAMEKSIPVIASAVGGIVDIVKDMKTGLLVKEKDPVELSQKIIELIENNDLADEIVKGAHEHIESYFSWERVASEYEKIYRNVVS